MSASGNNLPISILTDSYKAGHFIQYPEAQLMVAYGEFRKHYEGLNDDHRLVWFGIRYIVENYLHRKWTMEDVEKAEKFYSTHNVGFSQYPFPTELYTKIVKENNGYFPIKFEALPEGSVIYPHVPVYQISAENEYSRLTTFMETLLTMVWYPTCVATLSRRSRSLIEEYFEKTVDKSNFWKIPSRLHDFGFRGCTTVEQSVLGGCAHLLNFDGSDTMSACYYAQFTLNKGKPVATSIPATEHSVMTSWPNEKLAIENMIKHFGKGVFACVMDSYDYKNALSKVLPSIKEEKVKQGGFMVCRPDSGDPVESVLLGLNACESVFGCDTNEKGYKVIKGAGVIQGDGIDIHTIKKILIAAEKEKFSAENIAFGMGAGLLQKLNRDTMSFATKLSYIIYKDGTERDVMKYPLTDNGKYSLPGILRVEKDENGVPMVYIGKKEDIGSEKNMLKLVYDHGPVKGSFDETFDELRERINKEWSVLPKKADVISEELKKKCQVILEKHKEYMKELKKE